MNEINLYEPYMLNNPKRGFEPTEAGSVKTKFLKKLATWTLILGVVSIVVAFAPSVWYTLSGSAEKIASILARPVGDDFGDLANTTSDQKEAYQPRFDPTLSLENKLLIPSTSIETEIHEATLDNFEDALKKGVWRVSDFSTPAGRNSPVILAAHRYGYLTWSIPYRLKNSFYNLPKLEVGERVEVVWRQRKYVYKVYAESEGEEITDYSADLILYTCESLNSPIRVFKYARLLEI